MYVNALLDAEQFPIGVAIGGPLDPVEFASRLSAAMLAREYVNEPLPVIGDAVPLNAKPLPAAYPTDVTVPVPPVVIDTHCSPVPLTYANAWVPSAAHAGQVFAAGTAALPVQFERTVFAAIVGNCASVACPVTPVNGMAGTFEDAAVIRPFASTVNDGMEFGPPKEPTFALTVANVATAEPGPVAVTSPVNAVMAFGSPPPPPPVLYGIVKANCAGPPGEMPQMRAPVYSS